MVLHSTEPSNHQLPLEQELFPGIASQDFLRFTFSQRVVYQHQLNRAIKRTGRLCAVSARLRCINGQLLMWMEHDFRFLGGSLGCAEGEKLTRGLEMALRLRIPAVILCRSGGARMQEGTLSLMQMAKVSVAVQALKAARIPFISVCLDPCYGGVSASYAMQGDIRIAVSQARIGFAGPSVILNTMFNMDQDSYDRNCPQAFQTAEYVQSKGQLDIVLDQEEDLEDTISHAVRLLWTARHDPCASFVVEHNDQITDQHSNSPEHDFLKSRKLDRLQGIDVIETVFSQYLELCGDGMTSDDCCIHGGIALLGSKPVVVLCTRKGHDPVSMKESNYGMASPAGYRTALRLMRLANHFQIPLVSFIDTCGAYPSFDSEARGQSEALATNLLEMAKLTVPMICLVMGEGGSGGALAIGMGDRIAMLQNAYYAVISPEGAASILGRYDNEQHKAEQFSKDSASLASNQGVYADDLIQLGVIDEIIVEEDGETYDNCPKLLSRIADFLVRSLKNLQFKSPSNLQHERFEKFRNMGRFDDVPIENCQNRIKYAVENAIAKPRPDQLAKPKNEELQKNLKFIAEKIVNSEYSQYYGKQPSAMVIPQPIEHNDALGRTLSVNGKIVLDEHGPEALVSWIRGQSKVLITDTTMRDAHQSLLATRVRTKDLLNIADEVSHQLHDAFSIEMWGGATFDVCFRFLEENPWERLRLLRERIPNILFQMLLRGSNAVGYKSYPDNVIKEFVRLASRNGIDVFRIFDCFNSLDQMKLSIDTVRDCGKIAEVCICFTGDFLSPNETIYTLDYYKDLAERITQAGAHLIGIKDMAGLMKPQMVAPFLEAIRSVSDLPVHFHTHNTSSASLATALRMADFGCDIIDFATAAMADTTSQPSLNAFLAAMIGHQRDPMIDHLRLETIDKYWSQCRTMYQPFESGLKCGTARVYDHQIPGGQYSNLMAQARAMGTFGQWEEIVNMYRDVNLMFGDLIKVTPSSKCVGDMALFMITNGLTCDDILGPKGDLIEYPDSVVNLFKGMLGRPHHGLPEVLTKKILKDQQVMCKRPGELLEPENFDQIRSHLMEKFQISEVSEELLISWILYPAVVEAYMEKQDRYGTTLMMPSSVWFYGMTISDTFHYKGYEVKLDRVQSLSADGSRIVGFQVDGHDYKMKVQDASASLESNSTLPQADPEKSNEIPSPLPGTVEKVFVEVSDVVSEGDPLMMVCAMKMEVVVKALSPGVVVRVAASIGDRVDTGSLLLVVESD